MNSENQECPVCYENLTSTNTCHLRCDHLLCLTCKDRMTDNWTGHRTVKCPVCRTTTNLRELNPTTPQSPVTVINLAQSDSETEYTEYEPLSIARIRRTGFLSLGEIWRHFHFGGRNRRPGEQRPQEWNFFPSRGNEMVFVSEKCRECRGTMQGNYQEGALHTACARCLREATTQWRAVLPYGMDTGRMANPFTSNNYSCFGHSFEEYLGLVKNRLNIASSSGSYRRLNF